MNLKEVLNDEGYLLLPDLCVDSSLGRPNSTFVCTKDLFVELSLINE